MQTVAKAAVAALALGGPLAAAACADGTHVYLARFYLEGRDCLGTPSSIDVVSGQAPGECEPLCITQSRADGGRTVYVATMCGPYPSAVEFTLAGTDPSCPGALAALSRKDTCASDGGSSNPLPRQTLPISDASPP